MHTHSHVHHPPYAVPQWGPRLSYGLRALLSPSSLITQRSLRVLQRRRSCSPLFPPCRLVKVCLLGHRPRCALPSPRGAVCVTREHDKWALCPLFPPPPPLCACVLPSSVWSLLCLYRLLLCFHTSGVCACAFRSFPARAALTSTLAPHCPPRDDDRVRLWFFLTLFRERVRACVFVCAFP